MANKTWKNKEREFAGKFGAKRNIGSGSMGREERSCSDSTHETLYIETKYRKQSAIRGLYEDTEKKAKKEGKVPLVGLYDHGKGEPLAVMKLKDLPTIAFEYAKARLEQRKGDLPGQASLLED